MLDTIKQLLDWIYRKNCYFCHKPCSAGAMCRKCYEKIELNSAEPIKVINEVEIYSASLYTAELKKLIRGLKYHNQKELAKPLAELLFTYWKTLNLDKEDYEIIPMPLYPEREKERGYNHVALTAEEFSLLTGYPVNTTVIERIKNTRPQYKLTKKERAENLKNAFKVNLSGYKSKKLLLIDDICTTGTTFNEMIKTFKRNKITDLYALTAANPIGESFYQH